MDNFEEKTEQELSGYVSRYLYYETYTLRSLLESLTVTDSPKALELRNKDRVALIYAQGGKIVHAIESHYTLNDNAYLGRDALHAVSKYESVNFKEFHCERVLQPTLDLDADEIFDQRFQGENISLETLTNLIKKHPIIEMGLVLKNDLSSHNIFYTKSPDNYGMLNQDLLNYIKQTIQLMQRMHVEFPENIQLSLSRFKFKKVLIKQFGNDSILLFLQHKHVAKELLISFDDMEFSS
jgi:hypothetical protein